MSKPNQPPTRQEVVTILAALCENGYVNPSSEDCRNDFCAIMAWDLADRAAYWAENPEEARQRLKEAFESAKAADRIRKQSA